MSLHAHAPRGRIKAADGAHRSPRPSKPRCTAHSSRTGAPCQRYPIAGGTVCPTHGGRSPHVKAAAMARLKAFQDLALTRLFGLALQEQYPSTAYSAVRDVLDRTMGRPVETQHVTVATDADALDRILSQRASRVPGAVVPAAVPDDDE